MQSAAIWAEVAITVHERRSLGVTVAEPMTVKSSFAIRAFDAAAAYDELRLSTYLAKESVAAKIQIEPEYHGLLLRFSEVGYFNRLYARNEAVADHLDEIEQFYGESPFGCELVTACGNQQLIAEACTRRGWLPGRYYAWMHMKTGLATLKHEYPEISIRQPRPDERTSFLEFYLRGFEAPASNFPAAIRNMRHLFDLPQLHFRIASRKGQDAAIGMLCVQGEAAMLAAGATLPEQRRHGCHHAVLADRIRLAERLGCKDIVSYAYADSQSHLNMESMGLRTVSVAQAWQFKAAVRS